MPGRTEWPTATIQFRTAPDTIYCLASVTKLFTGVAITQLAQQGKVDFHETLGTYLDGFATDIANNVTVHQLLTHTSGLGDYTMIGDFQSQSSGWDTVARVWEGCMSYVRRDTLAFTPGSAYQYSNTAYFILGAIVARVSGQSYYDYVRRHVFDKAEMASSDFYKRPQWISDPRIARPYAERSSGGRADVVSQKLFIGTPAGDSFASANDLVRLVNALQRNRLLTPAYTQVLVGAKSPRPPLPAKPGKPPQVPFDAYGPGAVIVGDQWVMGTTAGHLASRGSRSPVGSRSR